MTDLKSNIRDGAYVALGAAALGVQHFSRKRQDVIAKIEPVVKDVTPKIKQASDKVVSTLSPVAEKVSEQVTTQVIPAASNVAEKVSTNIGPVANNVVSQIKCKAEQCITSTKKIADEAKRRVS